MNKKMKIVLVVILILGIGVVVVLNSKNYDPMSGNTNIIRNQERDVSQDVEVYEELAPLYIPEGWESYSNHEWGIAFAYPSGWSLATADYRVSLRGDNYDFRISQVGTGLPKANWTNPEYIIDSEVAKTWQTDSSKIKGGYQQVIVVRNFQFWIYTPDKTKEKSDMILSTIRLRK